MLICTSSGVTSSDTFTAGFGTSQVLFLTAFYRNQKLFLCWSLQQVGASSVPNFMPNWSPSVAGFLLAAGQTSWLLILHLLLHRFPSFCFKGFNNKLRKRVCLRLRWRASTHWQRALSTEASSIRPRTSSMRFKKLQ